MSILHCSVIFLWSQVVMPILYLSNIFSWSQNVISFFVVQCYFLSVLKRHGHFVLQHYFLTVIMCNFHCVQQHCLRPKTATSFSFLPKTQCPFCIETLFVLGFKGVVSILYCTNFVSTHYVLSFYVLQYYFLLVPRHHVIFALPHYFKLGLTERLSCS
jgi:hypothetical protein